MKGGDGDCSYTRNSSVQGSLFRSAQPLMEECIAKMRILGKSETFRIADLGCSSTHNSLDAVETIGKAVEELYGKENVCPPEFHVFFNDLPSNDFNLLSWIVSWPPFSKEEPPLRPFFSGIALAFTGERRLKYDQVPEKVQDKCSEAWNKGQAFMSREGNRAVAEAYVEQFKHDLSAFLNARGEEMIEGGRVFVLIPGRVSCDPAEKQGNMIAICGDAFTAAFRQLIQEGLIEEDKLDSFNLPLYTPSMDEIKAVVEAQGSFRVEKLQLLDARINGGDGALLNKDVFGREFSKGVRSVYESICEAHIGAQLIEELFDRVAKIAAQNQIEYINQIQTSHTLVLILVSIEKAN
eukprot:Gb_40376 [translate_table: standard]